MGKDSTSPRQQKLEPLDWIELSPIAGDKAPENAISGSISGHLPAIVIFAEPGRAYRAVIDATGETFYGVADADGIAVMRE